MREWQRWQAFAHRYTNGAQVKENTLAGNDSNVHATHDHAESVPTRKIFLDLLAIPKQ